MTDTTPPPLSVAAQAVIKATEHHGWLPSLAAAAIDEAARQLIPGCTDADRLQRMAFLALADELRGQPLSDASREALAEQFPAMRAAPLPAPAEHKPAPAQPGITPEALAEAIRAALAVPEHFGQIPEAIAEQLLAHPCTGPLLRGQAITPTRASERPWEGAGWIWAD